MRWSIQKSMLSDSASVGTTLLQRVFDGPRYAFEPEWATPEL